MIIFTLAIIGIIFGSFTNALVWRIHEQNALAGKKTKEAKKLRADLSISRGRSMCPNCHHTLAAKDLVPILSWILLRGKCRYCDTPISWQYPVVELVIGILFVVSYISWPLTLSGVGLFQFLLWLAFIVTFVALAIYDLRWFLLPDRIVFPVVVLASVQTLVIAIWLRSFSSLWQPLIGSMIIFGLFWGLYQLSRGEWIGGGDVKMSLALGMLAQTPLKACLIIFLASLLGTIVSIPALLKSKKGLKMRIPFGPPLLAATFVTVLYGTGFINWYQKLFTL